MGKTTYLRGWNILGKSHPLESCVGELVESSSVRIQTAILKDKTHLTALEGSIVVAPEEGRWYMEGQYGHPSLVIANLRHPGFLGHCRAQPGHALEHAGVTPWLPQRWIRRIMSLFQKRKWALVDEDVKLLTVSVPAGWWKLCYTWLIWKITL